MKELLAEKVLELEDILFELACSGNIEEHVDKALNKLDEMLLIINK